MSAFSNLELQSYNVLEEADLNWNVVKKPLFTRNDATFDKVPNQYALVREDSNDIISIVSERYQPIQNHQIVEFFNRFAETSGARITHAGHFKNKDIALFADLGLQSSPDNEEHKFFLLARSGHYPGSALQILLSTVRTICTNQFNVIDTGQKGFFYSWHNVTFDQIAQDRAKHTLDAAQNFIKKFNEELRFLMARPINDSTAKVMLIDQFGDPTKTFDDQPKLVTKSFEFFQNEPIGHQFKHEGTAYKLWNAVTEVLDHNPRERGRSALIGAGQTAKHEFFNRLQAA